MKTLEHVDLGTPRAPTSPRNLVALAVVLLGTAAFTRFVSPGGRYGTVSGDLAQQLLWVPVYPAAAALAMAAHRRAQMHASVVAFCGLALASIAWSVGPTFTFRRGVALIGTAACGWFLGSRFSRRDLIRLVAFAIAFAVTASLALGVLGVAAPMDEVHGTLRGVFVGKNNLGRWSALLLVLAATGSGLFDRSARLALAAPAMLALFAAGSITPLVAAVGALAASAVWLKFVGGTSNITRAMFMFGAATIVVIVAAVDVPQLFFAVSGRDANLTGRTGLWDAIWQAIAQRPVIGHGYGAFWTQGQDVATAVRNAAGFDAVHAHNGLMEILLSLGYVGLLALGLAVGRAVVVVNREIRKRVAGAHACAAFLLFFIIYNVAESAAMQYNDLFTALLVALTIESVPAADA